MKFTLRRIITGNRYVPEIDGLRFIAIMSVVLFHAFGYYSVRSGLAVTSSWITTFLIHGDRGVKLFFVISGFILGLPFADHYLKGRNLPSLRKYFLRRFTRLEPPYMINLLVCWVLLVLVKHQAGLFPHFLASLAYLHQFVFQAPSLVNGVAWSLEVEIQFYCLVPILTLLFLVRGKALRRVLLGAIMLFAGVLQTLVMPAPDSTLSLLPPGHLTLLYYIQFFIAGFLLADIYLLDWDRCPRPSWAWDFISLAGWPLVFWMPDGAVQIAMPFLTLLLYIAAFRGVVFRWFYTRPLITVIGGMCYSIYLFHYQIISAVGRATVRIHVGPAFWPDFAWHCLVTVLIIIPSCGFYYMLIERPCMDPAWPQKLLGWLRRGKAGASTTSVLVRTEGD
jgi:peptidoglycan/LPS O-acetylase OafA/YrhL